MSEKFHISVTPNIRRTVKEAADLERKRLFEMGHNPDDMTPGFYPAEISSLCEKFKCDAVDLSDRESAVLQELLLGLSDCLQKRTQLLCVPDTYIAEVQAELAFVNSLLEMLP